MGVLLPRSGLPSALCGVPPLPLLVKLSSPNRLPLLALRARFLHRQTEQQRHRLFTQFPRVLVLVTCTERRCICCKDMQCLENASTAGNCWEQSMLPAAPVLQALCLSKVAALPGSGLTPAVGSC